MYFLCTWFADCTKSMLPELAKFKPTIPQSRGQRADPSIYCKHLSQSLSTNKIVRLTSQAMDVHCPLKLKKIFRNPHTSFSIKVLLPRHSCCACFCVSTRVCVHPNRRSPNHPVRHGWLLFISDPETPYPLLSRERSLSNFVRTSTSMSAQEANSPMMARFLPLRIPGWRFL